MDLRGGSRKWIVSGYEGYINNDCELEGAKILVVVAASMWESFPQSNSSWEEAHCVELLLYKRYTNKVKAIRSCCRHAGHRYKAWDAKTNEGSSSERFAAVEKKL